MVKVRFTVRGLLTAPTVLPNPESDEMDAEGQNTAILYRVPDTYRGWYSAHRLRQINSYICRWMSTCHMESKLSLLTVEIWSGQSKASQDQLS